MPSQRWGESWRVDDFQHFPRIRQNISASLRSDAVRHLRSPHMPYKNRILKLFQDDPNLTPALWLLLSGEIPEA